MNGRRWMPRLVSLDVDGTLFAPGGRPSGRLRAALRAVGDAGGHVVIATGRSTVELAPVVAALELSSGFGVCSNGAAVAHLPDRMPVKTVTFDPAPVLERVLELVPSALIAVEEPGVGYAVTSRFPEGELHAPQAVRSLRQLMESPAIRVIVRDPGSSVADFLALAEQLDMRGISYAVGYKAWLDLGPAGVTKGSCLAELAADLGVTPDECLAIGDGRNDVEMLEWAGRGVAMGQAPDGVKACADAVAAPVDEDGAAVELGRWF